MSQIVTTDNNQLNEYLVGGFQKGNIYVISGNGKVGKTSLAFDFLYQFNRKSERINSLYKTFLIKTPVELDEMLELNPISKIVSDYKQDMYNSDIILFDFNFEFDTVQNYFLVMQFWKNCIANLKKEMTPYSAPLILILPLELDLGEEINYTQFIQEIKMRNIPLTNLLFLHRPEYLNKDKNEKFGTTYLKCLDLNNLRKGELHFRSYFNNRNFKMNN